MDAYVPRPQRGPSVRAGLFRKDEFRYDPASDSFLCPAGQRLHPYSSSLLRGLKKINYVNKQVCRDCPIRSQCTANRFRFVSRLENEAVLDRMQADHATWPRMRASRGPSDLSEAKFRAWEALKPDSGAFPWCHGFLVI
jgi:hypothetical protein